MAVPRAAHIFAHTQFKQQNCGSPEKAGMGWIFHPKTPITWSPGKVGHISSPDSFPFSSECNIKLILFDRVFPEWQLNLLHNQQSKI